MPPNYLLVDGHSFIFASPDLARRHESQASVAREELARRLQAYQDATKIRVVLVFDGRGAKLSSSADASSIQIIYSKSGQTADAVIERLVAQNAANCRMTVATNDHMERQTAVTFGADWLSCEELELELQRAQAELDETIRRLRRR